MNIIDISVIVLSLHICSNIQFNSDSIIYYNCALMQNYVLRHEDLADVKMHHDDDVVHAFLEGVLLLEANSFRVIPMPWYICS